MAGAGFCLILTILFLIQPAKPYLQPGESAIVLQDVTALVEIPYPGNGERRFVGHVSIPKGTLIALPVQEESGEKGTGRNADGQKNID
jgi:hypothetical protein